MTWAFAREAFLQQGHFVATIAFFGLFATVAILNAFPRRGAPPAPIFRALYIGIAVLLAAVLAVHIVLLPTTSAGDIPIALIAEAGALALFFAFWVGAGRRELERARFARSRRLTPLCLAAGEAAATVCG